MFHTVLYHQVDGVTLYEPSEPSTGWETAGEVIESLYAASRDGAAILYDCDIDPLPGGVADIHGAILGGDPLRLYALCYCGQDGGLEVQYYGIIESKEIVNA